MSTSAADQPMDPAAQARFAVDGDTAKLINDKLTSIQDLVASGRLTLGGLGVMPIGQGYAQQTVDRDKAIADGGGQQMTAFTQSLENLKHAVNASVAGYQAADASAHSNVNRTGNYW